MTSKKDNDYTPVRFSHLMSYSGIGGIVRGVENKLMVVSDIRYWTDKNNKITAELIPCVKRVSIALGIEKELRTPPVPIKNDKGDIVGGYIPAVIFPTWAVCKKCGLLHKNPWAKQNKKLSDKVFCEGEGCNGQPEQVTWCAVSNKGYLSDVPWHYLAHMNGKGSECKERYAEPSYLRLVPNNAGKGRVVCTHCKGYGFYEGAQWFAINHSQPWSKPKSSELGENEKTEVLEVNDPRVYSPKRMNALVIPPESRINRNSTMYRLYNNSEWRREYAKIKLPLRKKASLKAIATKYKCSVDDIKRYLEEIEDGDPYSDENITSNGLTKDEYDAFLFELDSVAEDEDFITKHLTKDLYALKDELSTDDLKPLIDMIENHIIATKLREIQIFNGFTRGDQTPKDEERPSESQDSIVPPDIVGEADWLPAIELFGEGIFFSLKESLISKWEDIPAIKIRAQEIATRYEKIDQSFDVEITPRFLLLHTLAHLLIRELESTAGYPAASLKERIYCSNCDKMAGVLIYTAVADIAGSLGGIVESGKPKSFLSLLDGVFKHAQWCSIDPVCSEHKGQGHGWLNRAACHCCALIPEPSCEYSNLFLDRVFIKGNKDLRIPNFLEFVSGNSDGGQNG